MSTSPCSSSSFSSLKLFPARVKEDPHEMTVYTWETLLIMITRETWNDQVRLKGNVNVMGFFCVCAVLESV